MSDGLSVLMMPDYTDDNPYQPQLIEALERRGVDVEATSPDILFPVLRECWTRGVPDVVHVHWAHRFVVTDRSLFVVLLGLRLLFDLTVVRLLGADVVWTVHNLYDHERRAPRAELLARHGLARVSDRMIVHCDVARETVAEAYRLPDRVADRIRIVPHGHYLDAYPNEVGREAAREDLDLPADATVVLYFGMIRPYKNVPELVETFRSIDDEDARLLVVGNPWTDDVEGRVREVCAGDDRVRPVLEFVPADEIQRYMNAADVVALPFDAVLTSGSALLGMSFGKPLIVPEIGCPASRVTGAGGILYDPEMPDGLRNALVRALDPATDLETMGEWNLEVARTLDWDSIAARTHAVYREEATAGDRIADPLSREAEA